MRIDNPTADQIKKGDLVHFKPQICEQNANASAVEGVYVAEGWFYPLAQIDYITREDTLEVGDEFTFTVISDYPCVVMAIADAHVMFRHSDGCVDCKPLSFFKDHNMRITKKASQ